MGNQPLECSGSLTSGGSTHAGEFELLEPSTAPRPTIVGPVVQFPAGFAMVCPFFEGDPRFFFSSIVVFLLHFFSQQLVEGIRYLGNIFSQAIGRAGSQDIWWAGLSRGNLVVDLTRFLWKIGLVSRGN